MSTHAEVLADSVHPVSAVRLTTMRLRYPRFIHSEFMTARLFARNASSSRAIPSARQRAMIRADPAVPLQWLKNQPGMQAAGPMPPRAARLASIVWLATMRVALLASALLDRLGAHKQFVNRLVEPWSHITVIVTGTDIAWANFFSLRRHKDADPMMQAIANEAARAMRTSPPRLLALGDWHMPLISDEERRTHNAKTLLRASAARCARTSYNNHDGSRPDVQKDLALFDRLTGSAPVHASPLEHQAQAVYHHPTLPLQGAGCYGAYSGWFQFRGTIPGECHRDLASVLAPEYGASEREAST